jgi:hypothetical protein
METGILEAVVPPLEHPMPASPVQALGDHLRPPDRTTDPFHLHSPPALIAILALVILPACSEQPAVPDGDHDQRPEVVAGAFAWGFEVSAFAPCGLDEEWWVGTPEAMLEAYRRTARHEYEYVFVRVRGMKSERGAWGHLGVYDRELNGVELLEMRPLAPDDPCRPER